MNDDPLTPEHGFPMRVVVPGYIGARSVKWLAKITLSDRPSPNHYIAEAYKLIQTEDKSELARAEQADECSVVCQRSRGRSYAGGSKSVRGASRAHGSSASRAPATARRSSDRVSWPG